jgi:hypothetical protein
MSEDEWSVTSYTKNYWDCPSCGEINGDTDADFANEEECEYCGLIVGIA